jgi:hypothetical protein
MISTSAGFPYWEVILDKNGRLTSEANGDAIVAEATAENLTDLFVFSHGWNNDQHYARQLYKGFFEQLRKVLDARSGRLSRAAAAIGVIGVIWPSMRWADEAQPLAPGAELALDNVSAESPLATTFEQLRNILDTPEEKSVLARMQELLEARPPDQERLREFHQLMRSLATDEPSEAEDNGEAAGLLASDPIAVFSRFATTARARREEGAVGLGDAFGTIWAGATQAFRQLTYWRMKSRAGVVGQAGLGPLLGRIEATSNLNLHLIGHSFGGRVISFALAGLPSPPRHPAGGARSAIKSLVLLQGAFSYFAFASALPHDPSRAGALAGKQGRVDGPIVVSHSRYDTAVGVLYPLASEIARQDAAGIAVSAWGAMGHLGAQAVDATPSDISVIGTAYELRPGKFLNLNCDTVIRRGGPPSGAHSDILHPELAWVALAASGIG